MRIKDTRVEPGTWVVGVAILGLGAFVGLVYVPLESAKATLEGQIRTLDDQISAAQAGIAKANLDEKQLADRKESLTKQLATMGDQQTVAYLFRQLSRCHAAMGLDVQSMVPDRDGGGAKQGPKNAVKPEDLPPVTPRRLLLQMRSGFRDLPEYLAAVDAVPGWAFVQNLAVSPPQTDKGGTDLSGSSLQVRMTVTTYAYREPGEGEGAQP